MNLVRRPGRRTSCALALLILAAVLASGCGRKAKAARHGTEEAAAIPVPTPDNTPIPALRTPAGLVLKLEEPGPATPTPPTTPAATPSPNPTP